VCVCICMCVFLLLRSQTIRWGSARLNIYIGPVVLCVYRLSYGLDSLMRLCYLSWPSLAALRCSTRRDFRYDVVVFVGTNIVCVHYLMTQHT